ncbi:MAG: hypothetical protein AB7S49_13005 [Arcobacter sp.]|uniref:hypothetical protein n=1 Tax=Arcobacter sp. TaxID=1872629 RepID=UPI003D00945F
MSKEESLKLLTIAAKYYNDKDTQMNTPALNEEQINAGYISTTEYTKEQIDEAYNYLINSSEGKTFIDSYKESMIAQPYFTSTSEQFNDSNYNSNSSIGLIDVSPEIIPAIKTGLTTVKATTDIVPSVFNGGKVVVNKLDDVYNEIGQKTSIYYNLTVKPSVESGIKFNVETGKAVINKLDDIDNSIGSWISIKKDNLPLPSSVKKWTTDNVTYDDFNDFYNPSMPASTAVGGSSAIIYDKAKEIINNLFNNEEKKNEEN